MWETSIVGAKVNLLQDSDDAFVPKLTRTSKQYVQKCIHLEHEYSSHTSDSWAPRETGNCLNISDHIWTKSLQSQREICVMNIFCYRRTDKVHQVKDCLDHLFIAKACIYRCDHGLSEKAVESSQKSFV